jgi:hypothetical protein
MAVEFPRPRIDGLQELAVRLFDKRPPGSDLKLLARELLRGFFDVCTFAGLDRVLADLAQAVPDLDISGRTTLEDHEPLFTALVAHLEGIDFDGGGPRNAKAGQLVDSIVTALGLTLVDEPDRTITLGDDVRGEVAAAIASAVDAELAVPAMRETIVADARRRCDASFHGAFTKIAAQLDDRGLKLVKTPKVPIDALHAVERALADARTALVERISRDAIDRAKAVIARADAEAANRIDLPITLRATPREVAILRACDARVAKTPGAVAHSLLDSLTQLAQLAWRAPAQPVHPYSASKTFSVGDLIEHPKFGRGAVTACLAQRIDVEFPDGKHTLVHVAPRR